MNHGTPVGGNAGYGKPACAEHSVACGGVPNPTPIVTAGHNQGAISVQMHSRDGVGVGRKLLQTLPVLTSHSLTVSSKEPETIRFHCGLKWTQNTKLVWPLKRLDGISGVHFPIRKSKVSCHRRLCNCLKSATY
ncbi:hypothetical protein R1flu_000132 [Riccia fluitans]|uniref:Uncharacterized protein n=1 Tax=Riccia fluitans TaxID=41844 RepID=A0ABD1Y2K2_9MARC